MRVCVYGASSSSIDKIYKDKCFSLGKKLAQKGFDLVYGAGSEGLMGASAEGFYAGGAKIHGVIPKFFKDDGYEAIFDKCSDITFTETMAERKTMMEDECDYFIVVPGGFGTFEELFQVLTLKQLGRHKKPIIIYNINGYYTGLIKFIDQGVEYGFIREECKKLFKVFDGEEEIIDFIDNYNGEEIEWSILKKN